MSEFLSVSVCLVSNKISVEPLVDCDSLSMCELVRTRARVYVCVSKRVIVFVCVCVCVRERESVCMCVCVGE